MESPKTQPDAQTSRATTSAAAAVTPGAGTDASDPRIVQMLFLAERGRLLSYIRGHFPQSLAPLVEPDDVLNDTYYEAARRMDTFRTTDGTSTFRFLVTIARRRIAQLLRIKGRAKRGGRSKRVAQTDSIVAEMAELAAHSRTPSRSAARHEFLAALRQSLDRLPEDLRTAASLHYVQGLRPGEVARSMNRTERAVHQLCYRAIQQIRRDLRSASLFI
jgi:RNA polymerase sigma factor (sigma-70 family)